MIANSDSFDDIFQRLRHLTTIRTQRDVARLVGVRFATVTENKSKNRFPKKWIEQIGRIFNIQDTQYISTGNGVKPESQGGVPDTFQEKIKEAQMRLGGRDKLARFLKIRPGVVETWECKAPAEDAIDSAVLEKIAGALQIPVKVLLYGADALPQPEIRLHKEDIKSRHDPITKKLVSSTIKMTIDFPGNKKFIGSLEVDVDHTLPNASIQRIEFPRESVSKLTRIARFRSENKNPTDVEIKAFKNELNKPEDLPDINSQISELRKKIWLLMEIKKEEEKSNR